MKNELNHSNNDNFKELQIQGDQITYNGMTAYTRSYLYKVAEEVSKQYPQKKIPLLKSNATTDEILYSMTQLSSQLTQPRSQETMNLSNAWDANDALAIAYYLQAPLEVIIEHLESKEGEVIRSVKHYCAAGNESIRNRIITLFFEANKELRKRYDNGRLIPNIYGKQSKGVFLNSLQNGDTQVNIQHKGYDDELIIDQYIIRKGQIKAEFVQSIIRRKDLKPKEYPQVVKHMVDIYDPNKEKEMEIIPNEVKTQVNQIMKNIIQNPNK